MSNEKDHIEELLAEEENAEQCGCDKDCECSCDEDPVAKIEKELAETKEKLLKQLAESENYRKRLVKETDDKIKYANQSLLSKFLPVLDNFDLALQYAEGVDVATVLEGVRLNQKVMLDTLEKAGVSKIVTETGDVFNPELHEAIALCNNPAMENNTIAAVVQNGYTLAGRVIRPVKVQVNKIN